MKKNHYLNESIKILEKEREKLESRKLSNEPKTLGTK